ncbi:MAG: YihY/virulence factor BrkB family protein [Actinobacteria bacterium]|nr:YihY/virulence factor BrkB family protein [Actinomycetota bacterium]
MTTDESTRGRVDRWAARRGTRLRGYNPWEILIDAVRAGADHRITGLAAEMAFFASLALIPFTAAFGGVLGYIEPMAGPSGAEETERVVTELMTVILGPDLAVDVAAPYVRAQLAQARGGLAIGGLIAGLWLASRVFLPAVHALDLAYDAVERRTVVRRRMIALGLAIASLFVMTLQVMLLVFGPLLGGARELAARFDLSTTFTVLWTIFQWPLLVVVLTAFLLVVYRYVPARRLNWRRSLTGAIVAVLVWLLVAIGFRVYLATGVRPGQGPAMTAEAMVSVGRAVGALVATVLWVFLSSIAVLFGGEINAAIDRRRQRS